MDEVDSLLDPVFSGVKTTISDANLYDNFWWDAVTEWTGVSDIDRFDEAVFGDDDSAASLAVSDHRPIWVTLNTGADDDGTNTPTSIGRRNWGGIKLGR